MIRMIGWMIEDGRDRGRRTEDRGQRAGDRGQKGKNAGILACWDN